MSVATSARAVLLGLICLSKPAWTMDPTGLAAIEGWKGWSNAVMREYARCRLEGSMQSFDQAGRMIGDVSLSVVQDGSRYRWGFWQKRKGEEVQRTLAYDGSLAWGLSKYLDGPSPASHGIIEPAKDGLAVDARQQYISGLAGIYPITFEQWLSQPLSPMTGADLPTLLVNEGDQLAVRSHAEYVELSLAKPPPGIPSRVTLRKIDRGYVPTELVLAPSNPQGMGVSAHIHYSDSSGILVPDSMESQYYRQSGGKRIFLTRSAYRVKAAVLDHDLPASQFQISYPKGARVLDKRLGRMYVAEERGLRDLWQWLAVGAMGICVVGVSLWLVLERTRMRPSSPRSE